MTLRMVDDNVLVELDPTQGERLASGLWTAPHEHTPIEGHVATVLASGPGIPYTYRLLPGRRAQPVDASPVVGIGFIANETQAGDRVLLESRDAGDRVPVETLLHLGLDPERHYRIVREAEIAGVLEP